MKEKIRSSFELFKNERALAHFEKGMTLLEIDHTQMDIGDFNIYMAKLEKLRDELFRMGPYRSTFAVALNKKADELENHVCAQIAAEHDQYPSENDVSIQTAHGIMFN